MKTLRGTSLASCALLAFVSLLIADSTASPQLEKMKSLAGDWEGKADNGKAMKANYKVVSGGSAVAETLSPSGEPEMLTVYHLDGGRLVMTHYCSMGNQPRMQADASAGNAQSLSFHFVSGTNMASKDAPHMHDMKITFNDADHITEEWSMKGGPMEKVAFQLQRIK
ncbi:MAG TPA: hypothetical protein VJA66_06250 [Thermoanaerobaculia bacterium]